MLPASKCLADIRLVPLTIGPSCLCAALRPKGHILLAHATERAAGIPLVLATDSNASTEVVQPYPKATSGSSSI